MITICTPTRDSVAAGFAYDLIGLTRYSPETIFTVSQGTYLSNLRTILVKTSLANHASHILFIDSDMRFPPETLSMLLKHDLDIVGANCVQRTQKQFTARRDGQFVSSIDKKGIERVDTLGFGVTLIKAEVFRKMQEPWFHTPFDGEKHVGEDVYFSTMAGEAGFEIYIDHDLSQKIRHCGIVEFGMEGY